VHPAPEHEPAGLSMDLMCPPSVATASIASRTEGRAGSGRLAMARRTSSCVGVSAAVAGAL